MGQFTLEELERISEGQTGKGEVYDRLAVLALVGCLVCIFWIMNSYTLISFMGLVLFVVLCLAFREASRLEKDVFIRLKTNSKFKSRDELRKEVETMKEYKKHTVWR